MPRLASTCALASTSAFFGSRLSAAPSAARAHPTEEHLLPLFIAYGAAGDDATVERVIDGYENGALSRDSFLFQ